MRVTFEERDAPLYRQIVRSVIGDVKRGELAPGYQLPTVRDLAAELGVARGTVQHAYDELTKLGITVMTQGRGTFVAEKEEHPESKKERAMQAISGTIAELSKLSFSPGEMRIFFELKLREFEEAGSGLKLAVVDCNPETLAVIFHQLRQIRGIDLYQFLLDEVLRQPLCIPADVALVLTTKTHYDGLRRALGSGVPLAKVALTPSQKTVVAVSNLRGKVAVMAQSAAFAGIATRDRAQLHESVVFAVSLFSRETDAAAFLADKDALLVPPGYGAFCSEAEQKAIEAFGQTHRVVTYEYIIDTGSIMYVEQEIAKLRS